MTTYRTTLALLAALATAPLTATAGGLAPELMNDNDAEALRIATAANACGDQDIVSAVFNAEGKVEATCGDVTAFVPLLVGGFGPAAAGALALLGAGVLAASGGGDTASDTQ